MCRSVKEKASLTNNQHHPSISEAAFIVLIHSALQIEILIGSKCNCANQIGTETVFYHLILRCSLENKEECIKKPWRIYLSKQSLDLCQVFASNSSFCRLAQFIAKITSWKIPSMGSNVMC